MNNELSGISGIQQAQSVSRKAVRLTTNLIQSKANKKKQAIWGKP